MADQHPPALPGTSSNQSNNGSLSDGPHGGHAGGHQQQQYNAAQFMDQVNRTIKHGQAVLHCRRNPFTAAPGGPVPPRTPPVWTPHKVWLSEALDYVGKHVSKEGRLRRGETLSSELGIGGTSSSGRGRSRRNEHERGDVVASIVLGRGGDESNDEAGWDEDGEDEEGGACGGIRTWIDGEVVVCEVASGVRNLRERNRVLEAWNQTWRKATSVVVIVGRKWGEAEQVLPWPAACARWAVLDQFRVAEFWMERRMESRWGAVGMVKLQKAELDKESWWMVGRPGAPAGVLPMAERRFWGDRWDDTKRIKCPTCDESSPAVYHECWLCLNSGCRNFWKEGLLLNGKGGPVVVNGGEKLTFHTDFLMARTVFDKDLKPSWDLVPDLKRSLEAWKNASTVMGTARMRSLWRGMVCELCRSVVPKRQWCRWECENGECHHRSGKPWYFIFDMGQIPLQAVVPRTFISWKGHPMLEPRWADEFGGSAKRLYRPTYVVDTWAEGDCMLKVISPTAEFNDHPAGPDQLFRRLLHDANQQAGGLGLTRSNRHPKLDDYFHKTFGVEYGISVGRRKSQTKPRSLETSPIVAQARDLLSVICHRELAGYQPEAANSVQVHAYMEGMNLDWHVDGEGDLGPTIATLSLGGDAELLIRAKVSDDEDDVDPLPLAEEDRRAQGIIRVPLIHGSVVIIYGPFDEHYEHKIECTGPLRFSVTARFVRRDIRAGMILDSRNGDRRFNGQAFVESDDEDESGDEPYSPSAWTPRIVISAAPKSTTKKRQRPTDFSPSASSPRHPAARHRGDQSPAEYYKEPGWTQAQKNIIFEWKKGGMAYKDIARRAEKAFNLTGRVRHENLRMVINREKLKRKKRAEVLGDTDDASSLAPSDSGSIAGDGKGWTQAETDRLVEYRSRDPPMPYKDIREVEGNKRTEKAYREQMTTQNRKKKGIPRPLRGAGVTTAQQQQNLPPLVSGRDGGMAAAQANGAKLPMATSPDDDEDVDMTEDNGEPPLPAPPQPHQADTRSSRASRSRTGQQEAAVVTTATPTPKGSGSGRSVMIQGVSGESASGMDGLEGPAARTRTRSRANIADDL